MTKATDSASERSDDLGDDGDEPLRQARRKKGASGDTGDKDDEHRLAHADSRGQRKHEEPNDPRHDVSDGGRQQGNVWAHSMEQGREARRVQGVIGTTPEQRHPERPLIWEKLWFRDPPGDTPPGPQRDREQTTVQQKRHGHAEDRCQSQRRVNITDEGQTGTDRQPRDDGRDNERQVRQGRSPHRDSPHGGHPNLASSLDRSPGWEVLDELRVVERSDHPPPVRRLPDECRPGVSGARQGRTSEDEADAERTRAGQRHVAGVTERTSRDHTQPDQPHDEDDDAGNLPTA